MSSFSHAVSTGACVGVGVCMFGFCMIMHGCMNTIDIKLIMFICHCAHTVLMYVCTYVCYFMCVLCAKCRHATTTFKASSPSQQVDAALPLPALM